MDQLDLRELLEYIDPSSLNYQEWLDVGMALKQEGYPVSIWDDWSRRDAGRYHAGDCGKKWDTFRGAAKPVTGGTIWQMAVAGGWQPEKGHELNWDDAIVWDSDRAVIDENWLEDREVHEPAVWDPVAQLTEYLSVLFEASENVGYVTQSYQNDKGKYIPRNKGNWDRTAGQLIEELSKCNGDIGKVIGDYDPEGGAWIRFNPLDGNGIRNDNVCDYRYALVESDDLEIARQNALYRELQLPIACLVHSGGKSLHAIVKIDAEDYSEYRKRVDYLYDVCQKNGLKIDTQNRNPSRLSRMPGVMRGGNKQFLVDTNIGKQSWVEWYEYFEGINDNLPDPESLAAVWNDMPDLSPCLIDGVLRNGHKMLIAGPSKAGKSFLLIELCIAIAEGKKWLQWQCSEGKVMYLNLELDRASCLHRFKDVYKAMGLTPDKSINIDIWNLRGKSVPMDKLAPKLIRRASKKDYKAIIIDPIYKVITGDENSADQMAQFCNQFDLVCTELGCAVIYCHHHSKGSQSGKKSMDRASGSGVFARDPDALLDLIQLETTDALLAQEENKAICSTCKQYLDAHFKCEDDLSQDDLLSSKVMLDYCSSHLDTWQLKRLNQLINDAKLKARQLTAWRIEGTLREFAPFKPVNLWFDYPSHRTDDTGSLSDIKPDDAGQPWERAVEKRKEMNAKKREESINAFEIAFTNLEIDGPVSYTALAESLGIDNKTVGAWFGTGKRARPELKKKYEKYTDKEGNEFFLKRKEGGCAQ